MSPAPTPSTAPARTANAGNVVAPATVPGAPIARAPVGKHVRKDAGPVAVTRAYIRTRWTYQASDAGGYTAALMGSPLTTPDFAARSRPGPAELARAGAAQETSTVTIAAAALAPEAPRTRRTAFTLITFTTTETYAGAGSGHPLEHVWSLRLSRSAAGPWRVAAVVIGD